MYALEQTKLPSSILKWIYSFLSNRCSYFSINGLETRPYNIQTGLPQGSALSPLLYIVYSQYAIKLITKHCKCDGYADDTTIRFTSRSLEKNLQAIGRTLELIIGKWSIPFNQPFAPEKSLIIHFTGRLKKGVNEDSPGPDLKIQLESSTIHIKAVHSTKHLGLTLDYRLSFQEHINKRIIKIRQIVGALTKLGYRQWGLDREIRLLAIRNIIYPTLSFSVVAWAPYISDTNMKDIDSALRKALIWANNLTFSTSTKSAFAEVGLLPAKEYLQWRCSTTLSKWMQLPHMKPHFENDYIDFRWEKKYCASLRNLVELNIFIPKTNDITIDIPKLNCPWTLHQPANMHIIIPESKEIALKEFKDNVPEDNTIRVYTDGSKTDDGVGSGWFYSINEEEFRGNAKLPKYCTIFQAEAIAIERAIKEIQTHPNERLVCFSKIHIFTDSWSVLTALNNLSISNSIEIRNLHQLIKESTKEIWLQWIPGHRDISGNEEADKIAKSATTSDLLIENAIPKSMNIVKTEIFSTCWNLWKERWRSPKPSSYFSDELPSLSHLLNIRKKLSIEECAMLSQFRCCRIDKQSSISINQNSSLPNSTCKCGAIETLKHILFSCWIYQDLRKQIKDEIFTMTGYRRISLKILLDDARMTPISSQYLISIYKRRKSIQNE